MKAQKSGAVCIFVGALLIVIFAVGLIAARDPGAFQLNHRYDYSLEQFVSFCAAIWLPAGITGFPLFLISLIISLIREGKSK